MKIYKLCDGNEYMYNMTTYLGEKLLNAAFNIMPTHGTVLQLTRKMHVLDTYYSRIINFSSPHLFSDLHNKKINCCGTVHHNRQGMPMNCGLKTLKLWIGDTDCRVKGGASATCWKDKRQVYLLSNKNNLPASGHFVKKKMHQSPRALKVTLKVRVLLM
jgi:hypothetical protein